MSDPPKPRRLMMSLTGTYKSLNDPHSGHRRDGTFPADVGIRDKEAIASILGAVQHAATTKKNVVVGVPQSQSQGPSVVNITPASEPGWAVINKLPLDAPPPPPDTSLLRDLFELTPVEAEVAVALLLHDDLDGIAAERGSSLETVRMHVKNILRKTGMPNQKKLTAMLARLGSLRGADAP